MNISSIDLNLLVALDALMSERNVTRAARRIGLSQPAVSAALARLRAALNDPLLIQIGPRLEPTDYALSLAEPLRTLLASQLLQAILRRSNRHRRPIGMIVKQTKSGLWHGAPCWRRF